MERRWGFGRRSTNPSAANAAAATSELRRRARQQGVVARLGQDALEGTASGRLFERAVGLATEALEVEYTKVLELLPGERELLLRAGVGWRDGLVGQARVPAARESQAGYTLLSDDPVVVEDLRTETRFRGPALLVDHGVVSGMSVVIRGRDGPWGVLGVHDRSRRSFTVQDVDFLQAVANILALTLERERWDADRRRLLESEREARAEADRRAGEEAALREIAAALGGAVSFGEAARIVVDAATEHSRAFGAYIERIERPEPGSWVEVVAVSGSGTPAFGTRVPYPGSLTEAIIESGEPEVVTEVGAIGERMAPYLARSCQRCTGLLVPLLAGRSVIGALVLLRSPEQDPFQADEVGFARAVGGAAAAALRRVVLSEQVEREQREKTAALEQRVRAEAELQERERQLRAVLDALPVGVFIADSAGRIESVNQAVREIWGEAAPTSRHPGEYAEYTGWWPRTGRRIEAHEWALARAVNRGEVSLGEEIEIETFEGERKFILNYALPIRDEGGGIGGAVAVIVDITDRKRWEEAQRLLAEAGRSLAATLEFEETLQEVASLMARHLADWCVIYVPTEDGSAIRRLAAASRDPHRSEGLDALAARYPVQRPHPVLSVLEAGRPELHAVVPDSLLEKLARDEAQLSVLRSAGIRSVMFAPLIARGRALGVIALLAGATRRHYDPDDLALAQELAALAAFAADNSRLFEEAARRAREEEALRRAAAAVTATFTEEEVIRQIARSAVDATNADGAFVERLDPARHHVEVVATAGRRTPPLGARTPYAGSVTERALEQAEPLVIENLAESGQGVVSLGAGCADCSAIVLPLIDAGEAIGSLVLLRDAEVDRFRSDEVARAWTFSDLAALAFRKVHLLKEAKLKRVELERVMESRARLMRGFSHDVKNPLGAADGFLQLLEAGMLDPLEPKQKEAVSRCRGSIRTALRLIDDLVELARAESGLLDLRREAVDVAEVARDVAEEYRAQARAKGLDMEVRLPDEHTLIESDSRRIRQILGNLLSNAVKYTDKGSIRVRVEHAGPQAPDRQGRFMEVRVSDTGPGIPAGRRHLLFREFARLDGDPAPGAGIGLAISRRLARALGGEITVESEPGRGSDFSLWLPFEPSAVDVPGEEDAIDR